MKACLFILVLFLFTKGYCQPHRFSTGVAAGPAFPLGKYAGKSGGDTRGQAQTGISLNLHIAYRISQTFGVTLVAGGQENKKSEPALRENIKQSVQGITTLKTDTKSWQIGKLMGGVIVHIPLADSGRIVFTGSATAGMCKSRVPGYSYSFVAVSGTSTLVASAIYGNQKLPWAFCYNIRSGIAFRVSKALYISGALSFFNATPEETRHRFGIPGQISPTYQIKHPVTSLSLEAGIEVQL